MVGVSGSGDMALLLADIMKCGPLCCVHGPPFQVSKLVDGPNELRNLQNIPITTNFKATFGILSFVPRGFPGGSKLTIFNDDHLPILYGRQLRQRTI